MSTTSSNARPRTPPTGPPPGWSPPPRAGLEPVVQRRRGLRRRRCTAPRRPYRRGTCPNAQRRRVTGPAGRPAAVALPERLTSVRPVPMSRRGHSALEGLPGGDLSRRGRLLLLPRRQLDAAGLAGRDRLDRRGRRGRRRAPAPASRRGRLVPVRGRGVPQLQRDRGGGRPD